MYKQMQQKMHGVIDHAHARSDDAHKMF